MIYSLKSSSLVLKMSEALVVLCASVDIIESLFTLPAMSTCTGSQTFNHSFYSLIIIGSEIPKLLTIVSNMKQSVLNQLDCAHYYNYKIRKIIVLILQLSGHVRRLTSKHYISRFTCLKCNRKTVLNSGNSAGTNPRRPEINSKLTQKS